MLYNVQKEEDRTEAEMKKILALAALNQEENAVEEITESTNSDEVKKREIEAIGSY